MEINDTGYGGLGFFIKKDSLFKELLKFPEIKPRLEYNYGDENGVVRDTMSPVTFEPLTINIECYLIADTVEELMDNRKELFRAITDPNGFTMTIQTLGVKVRLYFNSSSNFQTLRPIWMNGVKVLAFNLNLTYLYDEFVSEAYLVSEDGTYITDDEGNNIMVEFYDTLIL